MGRSSIKVLRVHKPKLYAEAYRHGEGARLVWVVRCCDGGLVNANDFVDGCELLAQQTAEYLECWKAVADG